MRIFDFILYTKWLHLWYYIWYFISQRPSALVAFITIMIQGQIAKRCFLITQENVSVDNR